MKRTILGLTIVSLLATTAFAGPIHTAAENGDLVGVQSELDKGADVNLKDNRGRIPLNNAARGGHKEVAELLIAVGADVNAKAGYSIPLASAASGGYKEIAELLIANGADVNVLDGAALRSAADGGHKEIVELLIANGTDVNAKDESGGTPLLGAAWQGHKEVVELLIAEGADVNAEGHFRETPLHKAVVMGHKKVTELLIAEGADVNAKADESLLFEGGSTPLHYATLRNNTEMVELLIAEGADVNAKGDYGNTPLFDAARQGHKEIAELLIDEGADVNAQYYRGDRRLTPLDKAKEKVSWDSLETKATKKEIADLLHEHGAKTFEELRVLIPRLSFTRSPFGFTFNTIEGKTYWVEAGMDLKKWNNLKEIKGTGDEVKFVDVRRIYFPQHFYRVKVVE